MMTLLFLGEEYSCAKAVRGDDYIILYDMDGRVTGRFMGIQRFDDYALVDDSGNAVSFSLPESTLEQQLAAANRALLEMAGEIHG